MWKVLSSCLGCIGSRVDCIKTSSILSNSKLKLTLPAGLVSSWLAVTAFIGLRSRGQSLSSLDLTSNYQFFHCFLPPDRFGDPELTSGLRRGVQEFDRLAWG